MENLDFVMVPLGLFVMGSYHAWLLYNIRRNPSRTVIGINAEIRHQWVFSMMADPVKNGVLVIQTIRNNIMASTLLATTAITLSSLISVVVSNTASFGYRTTLDQNNLFSDLTSIKYFSILLCFLVAFLCNVQSTRYYAHVSFLGTLPAWKGKTDSIEYVATCLSRATYFWSLGLRAFYFSFPLFLWLFGAIPMFLCSCLMACLLYFLDTTTAFTRNLHTQSFREEGRSCNDLESS
ncbi:hypothetical protein UlMin_008672 [Ulmus minor]